MKRSSMFLAVLLLAATPAPADRSHHDMVMQHGAQIMPFDQTAAMHMFTPDDRGGFVAVMVRGGSAKQVALVRSHLKAEATKFAAGDFSDPAFIHGKAMPGLPELSAGASRMIVTYAQTPMGAQIALRASDPKLIDAIHRWIAAQNADHRADSRPHCDMM